MNTIYKTVSTFCLGALIASQSIFAYEAKPEFIGTQRYQSFHTLQTGDIGLAQVVRVSLGNYDGPGVLVQEAVSGDDVYARLEKTTDTLSELPIRIVNHSSTNQSFGSQDAHYYAANTDVHVATVEIQGGPINSLVFDIPPHIARPDRISVGYSNEGRVEMFLDKIPYTGSVPLGGVIGNESNTNTFVIMFHTSNLFALSEVRAYSDTTIEQQTNAVLFVEPNSEYKIYVDPYFGATQSEASTRPLNTDKATKTIVPESKQDNPLFRDDYDADGLSDSVDLCPRVADASNADIDNNGRGDICEDKDQDGKVTAKDNCPSVYNPNQNDVDADGLGDACDTNDSRTTENMPYLMGLLFVSVAGVLLWLIYRSTRKK